MKELLELCSEYGVSGHEKNVADIVKRLFLQSTDEVYTDKIGNVIARVDNGAAFTLMLEAHLDEVGLIVSKIDDEGFIEFLPVGGVDSAILPAAEVIVHGRKDIFGVVGAKPPHLMSDSEKKEKLDFKNMFIDVGMNKAETEALVRVGDVISYRAEPCRMQNGRFSSKTVDNRAGIYIVAKCLQQLAKRCSDINIVALAAVQEELGCLGAKTAAFAIQPDVAVVIDVTHGNSHYIDKKQGFELGKGATVGIGPNFSCRYTKELIRCCESLGIPYQPEVCEGHSGTDAWPIQIAQNGIPCVLISVPLRHMHTAVELADLSDIETATNMICECVKAGVFKC